MCGTRHTFANAQIKYFAGVAEYDGTQVQSEPAKVYAEWFPDRSWGIAHGYGTKHIPIANAVRLGLRLLVTKESNPRPIDRIVEFRKTANPTVCNAKCRSARGPMCDCSCGGRNHGISVVMSRTRFAASDLDFKPTAEMAANAARGLELREKHGKGGTAVGVARARDIKNRANLSPDTVKRMHSFFSRHEGNQAGGEDDAGYIAWLLWGGDAGKAWAARKAAQIDKSESARGAARKASMALNPVISDALKFHTQKMGELLRQFISEAKQVHSTYADVGGAGRGFDPSWIAEQRGIVDNAISAMARGNIVGASNIVRQWADEFYGTYGHHEHSRNLAFLARAIAREPSHVVELAKAHKITLFRHSRKATMARELVGSKGNKRIYLGGPDGSGKYNLYLVQVANTGVPGESPAEDLIELKQFATEAKARSAAQKMLSSRPGAKAAFAANSVDLWNFLSRNDTSITRQNKNDLALHKKYAKMALSLPDFTPPSHAQHGPSLHTMAKDVLAEIKAWEEQVYRYRNRAPWDFSRPGAKARFGFEKSINIMLEDARIPAHAYDWQNGVLLVDEAYHDRIVQVLKSYVPWELTRLPKIERVKMSRPGKSSFSESAAWIAKYLPALNQWWRDRTDHPTDLDASSDRWEIEGVLDDVAEHCREAVPREAKPSWYAAALRDVKKLPHSRKGSMKSHFAVKKSVSGTLVTLVPKAKGAGWKSYYAEWPSAKDARVTNHGVLVERDDGRVTLTHTSGQVVSEGTAGFGSMSAIRMSRPGAKARFYTPPVKTGKNGPVTWDNLFVGHLGNGWTLANKGHEVNGDYERVAHIAYGGEITFAPGFNQARLDPRVKAYIHKLSVEAAQKKSAGEPLARTGSGQGIYSRARFANWETNLTKKYGKPIEEHTAKIGRNSWKIEVAEAMDGSVVANLYLWNDNRGFEHFESGSLQGLRSLAERTSRSDAAGIAKINRIANYARPGAKARFVEGDRVVEDFSWVHKATGRSVSSGGAVPWRTPSERDEWTKRPYFVLYSPRFNQTYGQMYKTRAEAEAALNRSLSSRSGVKSNGLTLAQRIAVAHDAKRMALR
jgi:hypothetical protein